MTTMQLHTEIYRTLSYLSDSEDYLDKALEYLKKLSREKKKAAKTSSGKKIHVTDGPLPTDKYCGLFVPQTQEEIEKLKEDYLQEKYGMYL